MFLYCRGDRLTGVYQSYAISKRTGVRRVGGGGLSKSDPMYIAGVIPDIPNSCPSNGPVLGQTQLEVKVIQG